MGVKDISVIVKAVDQVTGPIRGMKSKVDSFFGGISGLAKGLAAGAAAAALGSFFKGAIDEALAADLSVQRLSAALGNVGISFAEVEPQVEGAFSSIQKLTRFSDDDAREAMTRLVATTGDYQGSLQALPVVADLAAFKQISMADAADLVSKAQNGQTRVLKELGIQMREGVSVIDLISEKTRGFAERDAVSLTGRLQQMKNSWADIQEAVGLAIVKNEAVSGVMGLVAGALAKVAGFIEDNQDQISGFVSGVVELTSSAGSLLVTVLRPLGAFLADRLGPTWAFITTLLSGVKDAGVFLMDTLASMSAAFQGLQGKGLAPFTSFLSGAFRTQMELAQKLVLGMVAGVQGAIVAIQFGVGVLLSTLGAFGVGAKNLLRRVGIDIGDGVAEQMVATGAKMQAAAKVGFDGVIERFSVGYEAIGQKAKEGEEKVTETITEAEIIRRQKEAEERERRRKAAEEAQKEQAKRIEALQGEITVKQVQFERGLTEAQAKAWIQRQKDLGTFTSATVKTIGEAYAQIDKLNVLLAAGFGQRLTPAVKTTEQQFKKFSAVILPDVGDGFDRIAKATGKSREEVIKHSQAGGQWVQVGKRWIATGGDAAKEMASLGENLEMGARSAIDAAGALGLVGQAGQGVLNTIVNLGSSIAKTFTGALSVQGVIGIISGVGSLVKGFFGGKSPAQKSAEEALKKNTVTLGETNVRLGDLARLSTPGGKLATAEQVLAQFLRGSNANAGASQKRTASLAAALDKAGLSLSELDQIAKDLQIVIRDKDGNLRFELVAQLLQAIRSVEPTQFADTFAGQRESLRREASLFDLTDVEQAQKLLGLASGPLGAGILGERLGGFDFTTAGGREGAIAAIQQLFKDLPGLDKAALGGLTGQDFVTILEELKGFLSSVEEAADAVGAIPADVPEMGGLPSVAAATAGALPTVMAPLPESITAPSLNVVDLFVSMDRHLASLDAAVTGALMPQGVGGTGPVSVSADLTISQLTITGVAGGPEELQDAIARAAGQIQQRQIEQISVALRRELDLTELIRGNGELPR